MARSKKTNNKTAAEQTQEAQLIADDAAITPANKCYQIAKSIPTVNGTFKQRKMMAVNMLDGSESWTVTKKCQVAGVSRIEWYRITRTAKFGERLSAIQKQMKGIYAPAILRAFIRKALFGDADGFGNAGNQKTLLQDLEILKADVKGDTNVTVIITQEERNKKLEKGLNRFGIALNSDN